MERMENFYDVVVIGGGPAGLTAALYLARARYRVVVVEKDHFGGQITITSEVVNYPGVGRTSGTELTETMRKQAEGFGAEFLLAEVTGLELSGDIKTVRTGRGDLRCFGVLLATGAHPRMVGFQGEEQFRGRGVAYCATCDGEFPPGDHSHPGRRLHLRPGNSGCSQKPREDHRSHQHRGGGGVRRHFSPLSPVPEYQNRAGDQVPRSGRRNLRRVCLCRL